MGIAGVSILATLIIISIVAVVAIPNETFSQWNNPSSWISYPKIAIPVWVNLFLVEKIPEHKILDTPNEIIETSGNISVIFCIKKCHPILLRTDFRSNYGTKPDE